MPTDTSHWEDKLFFPQGCGQVVLPPGYIQGQQPISHPFGFCQVCLWATLLYFLFQLVVLLSVGWRCDSQRCKPLLQDISSILDHLLPHQWIQVIKRIGFFLSQCCGQVILSPGYIQGQQPVSYQFGLLPSLCFGCSCFLYLQLLPFFEEYSCILGSAQFSWQVVVCVLHPVCFVIDCSILLLICWTVLKLLPLFCLWTRSVIITIWPWSIFVCLVCTWTLIVLVEFVVFIILFEQRT